MHSSGSVCLGHDLSTFAAKYRARCCCCFCCSRDDDGAMIFMIPSAAPLRNCVDCAASAMNLHLFERPRPPPSAPLRLCTHTQGYNTYTIPAVVEVMVERRAETHMHVWMKRAALSVDSVLIRVP
uniref:Uncharacterized protein n=1 Tax=Trichogramma kaykai TaxID=54128 RepID=A0ABD2W3V2_9HYME